MKCPVCKTELNIFEKCHNCGFADLRTEFLSEEDANDWLQNIVNPYKEKYHLKNQFHNLKSDADDLNFQNEIRRNLRSTDDVRKDRINSENIALMNEANRTLKEIKLSLVNSAKKCKL